MKDNFSVQSKEYARFRPTYPAALYEFIFSQLKSFDTAWDCATGNGQVAAVLAKTFSHVYATDISHAQIQHAVQQENITYVVEPAEEASFPDDHFDLVTVGQALHWFDFDKFYKHAIRTLKKDGLIAVIGYDLFRGTPAINKVICTFYNYILTNYWDKERKYLDDQYKTIPFPFHEISTPQFKNTFSWTFDQLTGYLATWSAVQHYIKANGYNPLELVLDDLTEAWGANATHSFEFPILLRVGRP